jgi:hypothetical protein
MGDAAKHAVTQEMLMKMASFSPSVGSRRKRTSPLFYTNVSTFRFAPYIRNERLLRSKSD